MTDRGGWSSHQRGGWWVVPFAVGGAIVWGLIVVALVRLARG